MTDGNWPEEGSLAGRLLAFSPGRPGRSRRRKRGTVALRILHLLSQQPGKTGSGVYLQSMVRHGADAGFSQRVVAGIPAGAPVPHIPPLDPSQISTVVFGTVSLPFPVAGMSDVMPYESTRFSDFDRTMLAQYLQAFEAVISREVRSFSPHVIHSHHLWLITALSRVLVPRMPIVTTCHGTELRQLSLASGLAPFVIPGCGDVDRVMALHESHRHAIHEKYGIPLARIASVGAGYRDDIFCVPKGRSSVDKKRITIVYAGKLSRAKGLPWLIDAMGRLDQPAGTTVRLLIVGSGGGEECANIRQRAEGDARRICFLGPLPQEDLARVFREADIFVLPSFYEGLPLVVLEALACCCRVVVTDLPGIETWLPARLVDQGIVEKVPLPRLIGPDEPDPAGLDSFTSQLAAALNAQISRCLCDTPEWYDEAASRIAPMSWDGVFAKVKEIYREVTV